MTKLIVYHNYGKSSNRDNVSKLSIPFRQINVLLALGTKFWIQLNYDSIKLEPIDERTNSRFN